MNDEVEIDQNREEGTLHITQSDYIDKIAKKFEINSLTKFCTPAPAFFKVSKAIVLRR